MLNETIKQLWKAKGLSQEELAAKLGVVRQTISKWEQGLSVPDSDILIKLADVLDTRVSVLLGENVEADVDQDTIQQMLRNSKSWIRNMPETKKTSEKPGELFPWDWGFSAVLH